MLNRKSFLYIIVLVTLILASCTPDSDSHEAKASLFKSVNPKPVYLSGKDKAPLDKIKTDVSNLEEIFDVSVIQKGNQILVAYKVNHLNRFRMESIEQKITKKLSRDFPKYQFLVSSDMKIFLEAIELTVHVQKENYSKKKAEKWFGNIVQLQKEQT
ncbi:MAG: sporulation protein [Bacillales bacterium]|nr:sporulation protein [Bacillales bacterium]